MDLATDTNVSVLFESDHEIFRLFELPQDLAAKLESEKPSALYLKSATSSASKESQDFQAAVLCTDDKTFNLRQVHSSNSIFLIQSSESEGSEPASANLTIVGSLKTILEAQPADVDVVPIFQGLPSYNGQELPPQSEGVTNSGTLASSGRSELLSNAPVSRTEFDVMWTEITACELNGITYIPTPQILARAWHALNEAMTAEGIDPDAHLSIDDLCTLVVVDGFPRPLVKAILSRLSGDDVATTKDIRLDSKKATAWVGKMTLQALSVNDQPLGLQFFLQKWKDSLPAKWHSALSLELLEECILQPTSQTISYENTTASSSFGTHMSSKLNEKKSSTRKWHDKFRKRV
ncbi:MAG: hypothetical protein M1814_006599 [Vezdaea aestivalis]|nr:MAG: hypothetical protein M1814_006599 [Vezdaea aestivalis]